MKEGYELKVDNTVGEIIAKKEISQDSYKFRKREGYQIEIYPAVESETELLNLYIISKKEKGAGEIA